MSWNSWAFPAPLVDEAHEDFLEGALPRIEIFVADAEVAQTAQELGTPGPFRMRVESVFEVATVVAQSEAPIREPGGNGRKRLLQMHGELLLAELSHEADLLFDHHQLALVDYADAVRHLFGFFDVVRRK